MKKISVWVGIALAIVLTGCSKHPPVPLHTTVAQVGVLTVDPSLGEAKMIEAGKYGYVNPDVPASFNVTGDPKEQEHMVLVSFNRRATKEEVQAALEHLKLRPADYTECLTYGASVANHAPPYGVVCTGDPQLLANSNDDEPHVVALEHDADGHRGLHIEYLDPYQNVDLIYNAWNADAHFLAIAD